MPDGARNHGLPGGKMLARSIPFFLLILTLGCSTPARQAAVPTASPPAQIRAASPNPAAPPAPLPPDVVESSPEPGMEIGLDEPITIYFNQPMDRASVEAALTSQPASAAGLAWQDDATLTITPKEGLPPESGLTISLAESARSARGLALVEPIQLAFQTPGYLRLAQRLPEPGAGQVDPTSAVVAAFNRPVVPLGSDPARLPPAFSIEPPAEGRGEWINTSTYVFTPEPALEGGVRYTIRANPELRSTDGGPLEAEESWSFSTAPPQLLSIEPYTLLDLDGRITLTFNQPMDPSSAAAHLRLTAPDGAAVPGQAVWNDTGTILTFTANERLERDTDYVIELDERAQALGGTPLGAAWRSRLTTFPALAVQASLPAGGAHLDPYQNVRLTFTAPIQDKNVLQAVRFSPDVPNLNYYWSETEQQLMLFGDFAPNTEYTLQISSDLQDIWGGPLSQEFALTFVTAPLSPQIMLPGGSNMLFLTPRDASLAAQVTNISNLPLSVGELPFEDLLKMLGPEGYLFRQAYQSPRLRMWDQALTIEPDQNQTVDVYLSPEQQPLEPGLYFMQFYLSQEEAYTNHNVLVVSDIQLTFKLGATDALVWATDLRDNRPAADAPITIYAEDGAVLASGRTGADGVLHTGIPDVTEPYRTYYAVLGQPGEEDFSMAVSFWNSGISSWDFGLPAELRAPHLKIYFYSDRPIYRPGQTVFFRAVVRQAFNGRYTLPDLPSLPLALSGSMGEELAALDVPLSPFGTAHGQYTLPDDAPPGYYTLRSPASETSGLGFQVAAYRKPEINLQAAFAEDQVLAGETLSAQISARYFFDAPAGSLPVRWALYTAPGSFSLPGYQVGPEDTRWMQPFFYPSFPDPLGQFLAEGEAETAPDGTLTLELPSDAEPTQAGRRRYTLEVTAQDESGYPVSTRAEVKVNPAEYYIGVRPDQWVGRAGEQAGFHVRVVDWEKNPAGALGLRAEFQKVTWVRQDTGAPFPEPQYAPEYIFVASTDFVTSAQGEARLAFTPPEPGAYQLRILGERTQTDLTLWVGGPGQAVWPDLANQRLRLVADQESYRPGDTAQVFIPNPFATPSQALVTVERGKVLRHQVLRLAPGGEEIPLPLGVDDAPNVYVSVTLLDAGAAGRPDFRQGYLNLTVAPLRHTLNVSLTGQPEKAGPGEEVSLEIQVTDSDGAPVSGEFSLSLVDRAVLALADPNAPEIETAFFGPQPLGVQTASALAAYAWRQVTTPNGGGGGGGEMQEPVVREDFPDTAFWNAEITTDENGFAQVRVPLPDSLTTWQVLVRGLTQDTRVGEAEISLVAAKDLLVRPVTPRFFVVGDHVQLAAVVQNQTAGELPVEVRLQTSGFVLDAGSVEVQVVAVPAGGRARVEWWGTVQEAGQVDLIFSARSGPLEDAARPALGRLPVLRYTARQTFRTAGTLDEGGEVLELVSLPRSFEASGGELEVELSPSLAGTMVNALEALAHSPYECAEQTLSRFLPNLEAYRALQQLGFQSPDLEDRLNRTLTAGLDRLLERQNPDGGWAWWPGGLSDPYITAYVLFGLSRAQEAGIAIEETGIAQAGEYLLAAVRSNSPQTNPALAAWELDRLAFEHFALASAGMEDPSRVDELNALHAVKDRLSPWAQALLGAALERLDPGSERARTLFSDLQSAAVRSAAGVHWETSSQDPAGRGMMTPVASTAAVVYTLAPRDPASPLLAGAVRYLLAHRQADGAWDSTYTSAWTLLALVEYLKGTGELAGDFAYAAELNGVELAAGPAGEERAPTQPATARVPLDSLDPDLPNALTIRRQDGGGRLYYSASLTASQPAGSAAPLEKGLSLTRGYTLAGEAAPVGEARAGDLVTVRLALTLPKDMYYLVVEDYLPAGSEILDTRLKTSQQGAADAPQAERKYDPRTPFAEGWGWWYFHEAQVYDDHIAWAADYLPAGTYELTYTLVLLRPGEYQTLPARAWAFYFPEVQANSAGSIFRIEP